MKEGKVRETKILWGGALVIGLLALSGYAQQAATQPASPTPKPAIAAPKPATPPPAAAPAAAAPDADTPNRVVLKVGDQSVTSGDLDYFVNSLPQQGQQAAKQAGRQALGEQYAAGVALEQQALREHLDQDPEFQRQLELTRMQGLAKAEVQKLYGQITVSPDEISKYYAAHPEEFETLEVRRIVVRTKPVSTNPPAAGVDADAAKTRLETIRKELASGKDPAEVAKEFKDQSEGFIDLKTQSPRLAQLGPEWRDAVAKMKEGEVSEAHTVPDGVVALQLVKRSNQDLKEATGEIDRQLKQQRLQAAVEDLKKKSGVWMDDAYFSPPAPAPPPQAGAPAAPAPAPPTASAPPKQ